MLYNMCRRVMLYNICYVIDMCHVIKQMLCYITCVMLYNMCRVMLYNICYIMDMCHVI